MTDKYGYDQRSSPAVMVSLIASIVALFLSIVAIVLSYDPARAWLNGRPEVEMKAIPKPMAPDAPEFTSPSATDIAPLITPTPFPTTPTVEAAMTTGTEETSPTAKEAAKPKPTPRRKPRQP